MSKLFSKVACRIWGSDKFRKLDDFERTLYFYAMTSSHTNSAGILVCPLLYMVADIGRSSDTILLGLKKLKDIGLIYFNETENFIFVVNHLRHNMPNNQNHAKKLVNDIEAAPDCFEKAQAIKNHLSIWQKDKLNPKDKSLLIQMVRELESKYAPEDDIEPQEPAIIAPPQDKTFEFGQDPNLTPEEILEQDFETFWQDYPGGRGFDRRKGSKATSKAAYLKQRDTHSAEILSLGLRAYKTYLDAVGQLNMDCERFLKKQKFLEEWPIPEKHRNKDQSIDDLADQMRGK